MFDSPGHYPSRTIPHRLFFVQSFREKIIMLRGMAATIRRIVNTSKAPKAIGPYK